VLFSCEIRAGKFELIGLELSTTNDVAQALQHLTQVYDVLRQRRRIDDDVVQIDVTLLLKHFNCAKEE